MLVQCCSGSREHEEDKLLQIDLAITINVTLFEEFVHFVVTWRFSCSCQHQLQFTFVNISIIVGIKLLESCCNIICRSKSLLQHTNLLIGGGEEHAGEFSEANLSVVINVTHSEDGRQFTIRELCHGSSTTAH